ncbi:thioredoxin fold domain-containing protein [Paraflavisolibacter sp. H34]|uniref:TlpA family protein disulfide reductase n=1 Tax=Huijunlia imazamoxiresistens TaxID=3127457 RepID=UPI0030170C29
MKYILLLLLAFCQTAAFAQADTTLPPYKRFPTLPPLQLYLGDSTTKYTKASIPGNKPVLIMLFSPDCSHCQHTAEEMLQYKEEIKNIHIVMATLHPIWMMNEFVQKYRLTELPNVVVGKDVHFILPPFYNVKSLPYLAFYNRKGALLMGHEGSMPLQKALGIFGQSPESKTPKAKKEKE